MSLTIWTRENCEYCIQAKTVMNNRGISFVEKKLGTDFVRNDILTMFPTMKTYPIIVENSTGRVIGGFTEFITELHEKGNSFGKTLLKEGN